MIAAAAADNRPSPVGKLGGNSGWNWYCLLEIDTAAGGWVLSAQSGHSK
jgi:hypothetical protein